MRKLVLGMGLLGLAMIQMGCADQQAYREGMKFHNEGKYEEALIRLQYAHVKKPDNAEYTRALDECRQQLKSFYLQMAAEEKKKGNLRQATEYAYRASIQAPDQEVRQVLDGIIEAICWTSQAHGEALGKAQARDFAAAVEKLEEIKRLYPEYPGIAKEASGVKLAALAEQDLGAGELARSFYYFQSAREILPALAVLTECRTLVGGRLAESHVRRAAQYLEAHSYEQAWLCYLLASGYDSNQQAAASGIAQTRAALVKASSYKLALPEFGSTGKTQPLGEPLRQRTLADLGRKRPPVVIVEDSGHPDAVVRVTVKSFDIDVQKSVAKETTQYQNGVEVVKNPDYEKAKEELDLAVKGALTAQQNQTAQSMFSGGFGGLPGFSASGAGAFTRMGDAIAAGGMGEAQIKRDAAVVKLQTTPATIVVPKMVPFEYPVTTVTAKACLLLDVEVGAASGGSAILKKTLEAVHTATDRYVEADLAHNVAGDPLDMPKPEALEQAALDKAVAVLGDELRQVVRNHGQRLVQSAQEAKEKSDRDQVVKSGITYLVAYGGENTGDVERVSGLLKETLNEYDVKNLDVDSLLRTRLAGQ